MSQMATRIPNTSKPSQVAAAEKGLKLPPRAARCIAKNQELRTFVLEWQALETTLFAKARLAGISCSNATERELPQAKAMRELETRIEELTTWLNAEARDVSALNAQTIPDALAKIEMGLEVQGPHDWQDPAFALLNDGLLCLRCLLNGAAPASPRA